MSMNKLFKFSLPFMVILLALPLVACRQKQLVNRMDLPVAGLGNKSLSSSQVKGAILDACKELGWVARETQPGLISASLAARTHTAQVDIPFTGSRYSIIYKNSTNLRYDAANNTIHNQYNNWVEYLHQAIQANLAIL